MILINITHSINYLIDHLLCRSCISVTLLGQFRQSSIPHLAWRKCSPMKTVFLSKSPNNLALMYLRCKLFTPTGRHCGLDFLRMENCLNWSQKIWFIKFRMITLTCALWLKKISNFCGSVNNKDLCSKLASENCPHYTEPVNTQVGTLLLSQTCTYHDLSTDT